MEEPRDKDHGLQPGNRLKRVPIYESAAVWIERLDTNMVCASIEMSLKPSANFYSTAKSDHRIEEAVAALA